VLKGSLLNLNKFDQTDLDISSFDQNGELVEALSSLGFKKTELSSIITKVDPSLPLENRLNKPLDYSTDEQPFF